MEWRRGLETTEMIQEQQGGARTGRRAGDSAAGASETKDFGAALMRHRGLLSSSTVAGAIAGIAISLFVPNVYESRAVVQIGEVVRGTTPIESSEAVVERIKEEYRAIEPDGRAYLHDLRMNRSVKEILIFTARGDSAEEAQQFLASVTGKLLDGHRTALDQLARTTNLRAVVVERRVDALNQEAAALAAQLKSVAERDVASAVILTFRRSELLNTAANLEQERAELITAREGMKPTRLITAPTLLPERVEPSRTLYAITGALSGLFVGLLLVAFLILFRSWSRKGAQ